MPSDIVKLSRAEIDAKYRAYWERWPTAAKSKKLFEDSFDSAYPPPPRNYTATEIGGFSEDRLCGLWRREKVLAALQEIRRRQLFTVAEGELIAGHQISIGMGEKALECSWGPARTKNRTVTASGVRTQWVYGSQYVYTDNGKVTAWQD